MVTRLDWDSDCFGYPVGSLIVEGPSLFDMSILPDITEGFRLVYIFSKQEMPHLAEHALLADMKTVFERKTEPFADDFEDIHPYHGRVTDQLLRLAFISGEHSRFRRDRLFDNDEFRKLYNAWISNSVNRTMADEMFVCEEDKIMGFITLASKDGRSDVGLVAVDPEKRGRGIGTRLVRCAINKAYNMGCKTIRIVTQQENSEGIALYKSNGFDVSEVIYVYHYRWGITNRG